MVSKAANTATKRAATKAPTTAAAPAQKKAKMDPNCRGVLEAIQIADLPEAVKQMLLASAPKAFEGTKEQRHSSQEAVVSMIEEAIEGIVATMEENVSAATKQVEDSEAKRIQLSEEQEKKMATVTEALGILDAAKSLLKECSDRLDVAKVTLRESEEARSKGDESFNKAKEDQAALEAVFAGSLKAVEEGSGEDLAEQVDALARFVEGLAMDESLLTALPTSGSKKADARGSFDTLVIQQTRTTLEKRMEELRLAIEAGEPAAQERSALVASKEAEVAEATKKVEEATQKVEEADATGKVVAADLDAAQASLKEHEVQHGNLVKSLEAKQEEMENFKAYNVACFAMLKEKTAAVSPVMSDPAATAVTGGA